MMSARGRLRPRKKKKKKGFSLSLETVGLVAALVVISGIIVYLVKAPARPISTGTPRP